VEFWQNSRLTKKPTSGSIELGTNRLFLQVVVTPLDQVLPGNSLVLLQNLTQIRRLETIRRDFISNISHELRTPLASLKALTETLQEGALEDPPAAHRFLERMETEVDALSLMVSELLELARIESGRVPLKMEAAQPHQIISSAVDRLFLQAERAGLEVKIICPPELTDAYADSTRIEQVLVNLLHNAIKFTQKSGEITISAEAKGDYIQFSVQDTGIGIPKTEVNRIFERFYKTDPARSGSGTGLGLAISRHLVEAHRGRIWADSVEGKGSTFYFTIPKASR
jgi:two-component system, OmpR family, phosphate regulon sensor histidine kinase PhoR